MQNRELFRDYYPDNSASSTAPFKDVDLWREVRDLKLRPNNARMLEMLEKIATPDAPAERDAVHQMISHLVAFEAHIRNPDVDYSDHRFPPSFAEMVAKIAREVTVDSGSTKEYEEFLKRWLHENSVPTKQRGIFGSSLYLKKPQDVDILLILDATSIEARKLCAMHLTKLKRDFRARFGIPLHVFAPTEEERGQLADFIDNIPQLREF